MDSNTFTFEIYRDSSTKMLRTDISDTVSILARLLSEDDHRRHEHGVHAVMEVNTVAEAFGEMLDFKVGNICIVANREREGEFFVRFHKWPAARVEGQRPPEIAGPLRSRAVLCRILLSFFKQIKKEAADGWPSLHSHRPIPTSKTSLGEYRPELATKLTEVKTRLEKAEAAATNTKETSEESS